MFGMGFTEIIIILVIAILFLGPDKLPTAMVDIAKFFRQMKNTVGSMKESLEEEMNVSEIKQEALAYKKQLLEAQEKVEKVTKPDLGAKLTNLSDDILGDDDSAPEVKEETVTFKKKKKKTQEDDSIDV